MVTHLVGLLPAADRTTYECRAAARPRYEPGGAPPETIPLGSRTATTPRLALRWLRERTAAVADQLDTPYARPGRHWLNDAREHERALSSLAAGHAYRLTLHDDHTTYVITATPTRPKGNRW
ncbi:hypothetical protein ACWEFL_24825 [Streptomyces sp. NPDC004838]